MNGIICVYKPKDYTSFDIVAIMRKLTGIRKIGHGGTLDPMAEGVLPLFIGGATKAVDYLPSNEKGYYAGFRLGLSTDTQDITGTVLSESDSVVSQDEISITERFKGEISQIPPMYSAVSVNGVRLYDLARRGKVVERAARKVMIYDISVEDYHSMEGFLRVRCSKGTYIRTLIHDIGQALGVGAVMTSLVRTESCGFTLEDCHDLDMLRKKTRSEIEGLLIPTQNVYKDYPRITLDDVCTRLFSNGVVLDTGTLRLKNDYNGIYTVYDCRGGFIAIARASDSGTLEVIQRFKNV